MLQAKQLLGELQLAVNSLSVDKPTADSVSIAVQQQRPPLVILCGDLNASPDSTTCQVRSCLHVECIMLAVLDSCYAGLSCTYALLMLAPKACGNPAAS